MIMDVCLKDQALAQAGNTGWSQAIDRRSKGREQGDVTLFLVNSGSSASLSVTFEIGFHKEGDTPSSFRGDGGVDTGTITWVTPPSVTGANTAGEVTDMTAVDCNGSECCARVVLPTTSFVHFKITENGNNSANNVSLYMAHN